MSDEGVFRCPGCQQQYVVPETTIAAIRVHMLRTHDQNVDARWVRRRLKEQG